MPFKYYYRYLSFLLSLTIISVSQAQIVRNASALTLDQIMQGNAFVGTSPSNIFWSEDGKRVYFNWNPRHNRKDSLYVTDTNGKNIRPVKFADALALPSPTGNYSRDYSRKVYEKNGDIFVVETKTGKVQQITHTVEREYAPAFSVDGKRIYYQYHSNLFAWHVATGQVKQLTNLMKGQKNAAPPKTEQEKWLGTQQTDLLQIIKEREQDNLAVRKQERIVASRLPKHILTGDKWPDNLILSPDERYVTFRLFTNPPNAKNTLVPNYVTSSGFTEDIPARTKVGSPQASYELHLYDRQLDTVYQVSFSSIPGIQDVPAFTSGKKPTKEPAKPTDRAVVPYGPFWSDNGKKAFLVVRSVDNKDRWLLQFNPTDRSLKLLNRQHDEAWINGPGIGYGAGDVGWLPDNEHIWFQSEETGYSHLYLVNTTTGAKRPLTEGNFEISNIRLARDKKNWYFNANKEHPGDVQFYRLPLMGGRMVQITNLAGNHEVTLSPDEKMLALRYSSSTKPWELYLMPNRPGAAMQQVTYSQTEAFKKYKWREPEVISFKATDGVPVFARLYRPANAKPQGPAVIFVHGAGYLQNAHKWWSLYFREYMFHNYLVDNGYTVLDIDYRGSAGYGRDVRTGIYRHMGGKDLSDHLDGARLLMQQYGVDPKRIGIYGGSYGGFITLMAMFTQPDVFAAGAALRSVTDWAHYNHGYTSNILNEPFTDSLAYRRSSPIYYAEGLKGALLLCHGMVDTNVHFQDIVRLSQRLIELRKENWELAVYPVEDHAFTEPTSWADEYKRIYKLFEFNLKKE